jgi:hypothetical protein
MLTLPRASYIATDGSVVERERQVLPTRRPIVSIFRSTGTKR